MTSSTEYGQEMRPTGVNARQQELHPTQSDRAVGQKGRRSAEEKARKSGTPVTFFLKSEEELAIQSQEDETSPRGSTFGVQSLTEAIDDTGSGELRSRHEELHPDQNILTDPNDTTQESSQSPTARAAAPSSAAASSPTRSPVRQLTRPPSAKTLSLPLTPVHDLSPNGSSAPVSTPRSVSLRSFGLSDDDQDESSQAIASSSEGEEDGDNADESSRRENDQDESTGRDDNHDSAVQLVMPSILMPSRRPFTEKGKHMGKLKIMVAGGNLCGKTSLIKSIVRACDHIIHVDPTSSAQRSPKPLRRAQQQHSAGASARRPDFVETSASTRAYPSWWSDMDDSRGPRRGSVTDAVLERNLTFIEAPGWSTPKIDHTKVRALSYLQDSMEQNLSFSSLRDSELLQIMSGSGGAQVDLIIYILTFNSYTIELHTIQELSRYATVIPVIGSADILSEERLSTIQKGVQSRLSPAVSSDSVSSPPSSALEALLRHQKIPAISSLLSEDDENMDASLLMSSEYIQPLVQSDLQQLVSDIFNPDAAAHLRHLSAKKLVAWRREQNSNTARGAQRRSTTLPLPTFHHAAVSSTSLAPTTSTTPGTSALTPNTLARLNDHTHQEERLAQVHLARWASGLQRALHNERARFASLQDTERTTWLQDRLDERVDPDSKETSLSSSHIIKRDPRRSMPSWSRASTLDPRDPLGLLDWNQRILNNSLAIVQVVGGASVVGALMVWIVRAWGWDDGSEWDGPFGDVLWPWSR
ncbi:MAG: hypothetical protein M1828_002989 [Chrysothrix sp. TS-e1954]|nr:MAG: hypothetical protein M1828_002989 [Chrysothrix sp. TS-e1954]